MLQQQECQHLKDYLSDAYTSDVQAAASTLKDYKFSGAEVQQLLANHDIYYERDEVWIPEERLYEVIYYFEMEAS